MIKVSVIIVSYNVCKFLEQTLISVLKATNHIGSEVIVVDNHSVDGSVEMMASKFPQVKVIANKDNFGFSKANNQGIHIAKGEHILLLNPDTVVDEFTLLKTAHFMDEHPDAGGLGVKMVDGRGHFLPESKRSLPTPWIAFCKIFGLSLIFPKSKKFGRYHLGYLSENETHEVDVLSGAFMMLRASVLAEIGLLDEAFFMYGEDIDLSYRITQAGYKNYYFPETKIIHYKGESTKKTSVNYVFIFYNAMIIFYRKHFATQGADVFTFMIKSAIYIRALLSIVYRFVSSTALPLIDFAIGYGGIFCMKEFWETQMKGSSHYYPHEFMEWVVPFQLIVWQSAVSYFGGYDKPYRVSRIFSGMFIGLVFISAWSNFYEPMRYSRGLLLLGAGWVTIAMLALRYFLHFMRSGNFKLGEGKEKRVLIVGDAAESNRVNDLLSHAHIKGQVLGYLSVHGGKAKNPGYLGTAENLPSVAEMYKANEIIFCAKDLKANMIMNFMTSLSHKEIEYRIVPDDSDFIIGSHSKNKQGDFYAINFNLALVDKNNMRVKRFLDLGLSSLLLISFPLVFWMMQHPLQYFSNILDVLTGRYSWVGFASKEIVNLPRIKQGILTTVSSLNAHDLDMKSIRKHDMSYAQEYSILLDLKLIMRSFDKLDAAMA